MTMNSQMHQEIQAWRARSYAEFEQKAKEEANRPDTGIPETVLAAFAEYDRGIHERNQLPVGMLLDLISAKHLGDRSATTYQLMVVAEVARDLLFAAIFHPDATEDFLQEARGEIGPLVDMALDQYGW